MTEPVTRWIDGPVDTSQLRFRIRVASTPVVVDLVPWGDEGAELIVRPAHRPRFTWSPRREQRYFDHAHATADVLARALRRGPSLAVNAHQGVSRSRQQEGVRVFA